MNASQRPAASQPSAQPPSGGWLSLQRLPVLLALLTLAMPVLLSGYFSEKVNFKRCVVRQPLVQAQDATLHITGFDTLQGLPIAVGESYCDGEAPLRLSGRTSLPDGTRLRVFQKETQGQYFLVQPAIDIKNGEWHIAELLAGGDIREIRFAVVDETTNADINERTSHSDWGPAPLPPQLQPVATIELMPASSCAEIDGRVCMK